MSESRGTTCPHCGAPLTPLGIPEALFAYAHDRACFNDDCPYFVRGWDWMERQYGVRASYRYRIDGETGHASPMAVRGSGVSPGIAIADPAAGVGSSEDPS
jgi:hypothetical protein